MPFVPSDSINITPSTAFTPTMQGGPKGNPAIVEVSIVRVSDQQVVYGPSNDGVVELMHNTGLYACTATVSPSAVGQYSVIWNDGTDNFGSQDMFVSASPVIPTPTPSADDETLPCQLWTSGAEILAYCQTAQQAGISGTTLDDYAAVASSVLYELSGRRFGGLCTTSVRPCRIGCGCDWRIMAWYNNTTPGYGGFYGWNAGWWWGGVNRCGCGATSEVKLPGYPIQSIDSVSIDGNTIDSSAYRLDRRRFLVAQKDSNGEYNPWPTCQDMTLSDTPGPGRFIVSYTWGVNPPIAGRKAAIELGCEMASSIMGGACNLPANTVTVTRQGVQINRATVNMWLSGNATGLISVDTFLATANPNRLRRRPSVYSPDVAKYARKLGT